MRCQVIHAPRWIVLSIAVVLCPVATRAQTFPAKPVRYVIPFDVGSSPDIVGRMLADRFTRLWGQQVIVDNRVGAAGVIGTAYVAKSPPDGYTLLQCNIASSAIAVTLFAKMPYDQVRDIAPVARIGMTPNVVTVHPSVPIRSIKELVAYAKAHPGELSYSSSLPGTSPHLSIELLKQMAKINVVNIPYRLGVQAITDTMGGQVPINISNFPLTVSPVQSGRLRAIAVTTATRASQLPAVPTVREAGFPDYDVSSWQGICAPAGMPAPLLDKLNTDINTVLRMPDVQQRLQEVVMEGPTTSRKEFDQFIRAEIARWAQVIKDAGIPPQ
jgi:tripartite-type tricarboxylate transporter receptor subunit TctC